MEAHGGYLCRTEGFGPANLLELARQALVLDGHDAPMDCALQVSVLQAKGIFRLAYDSPHTYGRKGARWYATHHGLARLLSAHLSCTVHAYVFDPEELEQVTTYGDARKVGGERVRYSDVELPGGDDDLPDEAFEALKNSWPLGHLARVLGVPRDQLLRLPRTPSVLLDLSAPMLDDTQARELAALIEAGRTSFLESPRESVLFQALELEKA